MTRPHPASATTSAPAGDPRLRVAKNTAVLLALRVGMPLVSVAVVLAVSRCLGTDGLGRYTLAFTFLYFFNTLAPLGLYALITRDGARDRAHLEGLLGNAVILGTGSSLLLTVTMAVLGRHLGYDDATQSALILLSLSILPATLVTFFEGTFAALERMEYIALETLAENAVKVGVGVILLWTGYGLAAVMGAAVAGRVLACIISMGLLRRAGVRLRWVVDLDVLRSLVGAAPTFLLISIFATLYWRIDVFMLSQLRPVEDVGYYGAAYRLLELAMVVPQSLCLALYPQMAHAAHTNPAALAPLGRAALRYLTALTLPAALCTTLLAGPMLALLYGEPLRAAAYTLSVLIWTVVPYAWVRYHAYVLVAAEHQRVDLALNVVMSITNIVLNLILIPIYGHLGAAVATFVSICLYGAGQYTYLRRNLPGHLTPVPLQPIPIAATALTGLCVWLLAEKSLTLALVVAPALYVSALLAAGFFTETELRLLRLDRALRSIGLSARVV